MKSIKIFTTIILILIFTGLKCQEFKFTWTVDPSFTFNYYVIIENKNDIGQLSIIKGSSNDTLKKVIDQSYVTRLYKFLKKYNYPNRGADIIDSIKQEYVETNYLYDSALMIIEKDTFRTELFRVLAHPYNYDIGKNQYYRTITYGKFWTDGTTFSGHFQSQEIDKSYSLFCARFNKLDYELNKILIKIITENDYPLKYSELEKEVEMTKPRK